MPWRVWRCRYADKKVTRAAVGADELRPEVRSRGVAHQHLTSARGLFQHGDPRSGWPQQNQHPVQGRVSRQYEVNWTRLDTCGGRSLTRPIDVVARPDWPRARCIRRAARAARRPWSGPSNSSSSASPPHLRRSAPSSSASVNSWLKTVSRRLLSSSAPSRPRRASRSVSGVKPVMSNISRLPSTTRWAGPGSAAAHAGSSRGTYAVATGPSPDAASPISSATTATVNGDD